MDASPPGSLPAAYGQDRASSDPRAIARRVLILAAEFPPLGGGGVMRMAKLAKYLGRMGWHVTVVSSDEPLTAHRDPALLEELPATVTVRAVRAPFGAAVTGLTAGAKARLPRTSRPFRLLFATRAAARRTLAIPDRWVAWAVRVGRMPAASLGLPDVVLSSGPPHSSHLAGAYLSGRLQIPLVIDLRDEWTLRPSTRSRLPWRRWLEARLERWAFRRAAAIVVVSEESRTRYRARYPRLRARWVTIPNGYDPEDLPSRISRASGSSITIGYAGSFQAGLDIRPLFEALGALVREEAHGGRAVAIELLGPIEPERISIARELVGPSLVVGSFVQHRAALVKMASWDALVVVADDGGASLAGKTYECLALGKPILVVAPDGPATRLVTSLGVGFAAPPGDAAAIREAGSGVLALARNPKFTGAVRADLAIYDRAAQAARWAELLADVIALGSPRPAARLRGRTAPRRAGRPPDGSR